MLLYENINEVIYNGRHFQNYENVVKNYEYFDRDFKENKVNALKLLFYIRDIQQGLGEREVFRWMLVFISKHNAELTLKLFKEDITKFGRYDDEFAYYDILHPLAKALVMEKVSQQLDEDIYLMKQNKPISLLAKWLPSINTSSVNTRYIADLIRKDLNLSPRQYRKMLSKLRKHIDIVETRICNLDYKNIDYFSLPKNAIEYHYNAFMKNDTEKFKEFLSNRTMMYQQKKIDDLENILSNKRYDLAENIFSN